MNDWFDRKQQQLTEKGQEQATQRQIRGQILATVPYFWDDMLGAINEGAKKWNQYKGRDAVYMLDAAGPADTKSVNLIGPDDRIAIRFAYQVPQVIYGSETSRARGTFTFVLENGQVRLAPDDKTIASLTAADAAGYFLDRVLQG